MQKNRPNSDSGKHALVPPPHSCTPARIPAPHSSNSGMRKFLGGKNQSEDPRPSLKSSVQLPAPREPSPVPLPPCDKITGIPPPESELGAPSKRTPRGFFRTSAIEQVVNNIYPELAGTQITVKNGKVLLGSRRVGSLIKKSESPERIRIWVDRVLSEEQKQAYCSRERFPCDPKVLGALLPLSVIFGMACVGDCRPLMAAVSTMRYAAIVTDGFAVRLEFHAKKCAEPSQSFILKLRA